MRRWNHRGTNLFLVGAALAAGPLIAVAAPAIAHAECVAPEGVQPGDPAAECDEASQAPAQWSIDPTLTPEQNLTNLINTYPPQLNEPLIQNSAVDEMPVQVAPTVALPGVGVNLWPDLTPFVAGAAGATLAPNLPPPDLSGLGQALQQLPPPQMPAPPPRLVPPMCGPEITPFFTPCI